MATYPKPFRDIPNLIALLRSRGMEISDIDAAGKCLQRVGYYRLSGYWYPMRSSHEVLVDGIASTVVEESFRDNTTFTHAHELYVFDKKLRLLMLDAIERVEVGLKVQVAQILGQRNPTAYLDATELHGNFSRKDAKGPTKHEKWVTKYRRNEEQSQEDFIKPFLDGHAGNEFPIWMAIEFWDFGTLSHFLPGMKVTDRQTLAKWYGLEREELLLGWIRALNSVRNTCAHHSRLWNRPLKDNPKPPKQGDHHLLDHLVNDTLAQTRLYTAAAALQFLLRTMHPTSSWGSKLQELCDAIPKAPNVSLRQSGFPDGWRNQKLWLT